MQSGKRLEITAMQSGKRLAGGPQPGHIVNLTGGQYKFTGG